MEAQPVQPLTFLSAWILIAFLPPFHLGLETPSLHLESTVFVAIRGSERLFNFSLKIPANESSSMFRCFDPEQRQIFNSTIKATESKPMDLVRRVPLKNMRSSGEYSCQYKTAKVYWFLRLRDRGFEELTNLDFTECIVISVLSGVLLIFSVTGSAYVLRGYWFNAVKVPVFLLETDDFTLILNIKRVCSRKNKPKKEAKEEPKLGENSVETVATPPPSFYASLEPRPRSIYDVLDHSAAKAEPDPREDKPKKKESHKTVAETKPPGQEDVFESVYENF